MSAALDEESYARAALTYLAEPGDLRLGALVRDRGAASTLAAIKTGEFPDLASPRRRRDTSHAALAGAAG